MKTLLLCIILISAVNFSYSQHRHAINVMAGYSKHGSGDMRGIMFGFGIKKYHRKSLSFEYNLRSTINHSHHGYIVVNSTSGTTTDNSVRFTTAGVQLGVNGALDVLPGLADELSIGIGVFGRYQSASNGSDGYSVYYPTATNPTFLIEYNNSTEQNTAAVGGMLQISYEHLFQKTAIGFAAAFQTDTNGDAIPHAAVTVSRKLK